MQRIILVVAMLVGIPLAFLALNAAHRPPDTVLHRGNSGGSERSGLSLPQPGKTVPELIAASRDPDALNRWKACWALKERGPQARPAVPTLRLRLRDSEPIVRAAAARALWYINRNPRESVPCLVSLLRPEVGPDAQCWAGVTLYSVGEPAIPYLTAALDDKDAKFRREVVFMLHQIGSERPTRPDVPWLRMALHDEDKYVREAAARGLRDVPLR